MKFSLKKIDQESLKIFLIVIISNVLVDLASEGNLSRIASRPVRFFGLAVLLSILGGLIMAKVNELSKKQSR